STPIAVLDPPVSIAGAGALEHPPLRWSRPRRIAFRFFFAYFVLYSYTIVANVFPTRYVPGTAWIIAQFGRLWQGLAGWVGNRIFDVEISTVRNGSGDTTYAYVLVLTMLVIAVVATSVWSLLDRRRLAYPRLEDGLRTWLRFGLALTMLQY